jgi:AcrR family transcriptional regulator
LPFFLGGGFIIVNLSVMSDDVFGEQGTSPTRRKRSDGLRTIERVLKAAEEEMTEFGFVNFNLDRVIQRSDVARSSVYHHFGGRDGVIAALETTSTMRSLERGLSEFESLLDTFTSGEQAFQLIELGIRSFGSSENKRRRQRRISSLSAAQNSPAIRKVLAREQRAGSEVFARVLEKAQSNGLCTPVGPIFGLAYVIQSMLVGRILVDISDDEALDHQWEDAAIAVLRETLRPNP